MLRVAKEHDLWSGVRRKCSAGDLDALDMLAYFAQVIYTALEASELIIETLRRETGAFPG